MNVLARIGALVLAVIGLVALFYLGFIGIFAGAYGFSDEPESAGAAGVVIAVVALVLAGGVAAGMLWLVVFAITGRGPRVSLGRAALGAAAGFVGVLLFCFGLLLR